MNRGIHAKLDEILRMQREILARLTKGQNTMSLDFTALQGAIQANTDAVSSAEGLLTALSAEIKTLADSVSNPADQQKLADFAASLSAKASDLAHAVAANTPAAPAPAPPPAAA